jgi:hypothetical protein
LFCSDRGLGGINLVLFLHWYLDLRIQQKQLESLVNQLAGASR